MYTEAMFECILIQHPKGNTTNSLGSSDLVGKLELTALFGGDGKNLCWDMPYRYNYPTTSSVNFIILKIKEKIIFLQARETQRDVHIRHLKGNKVCIQNSKEVNTGAQRPVNREYTCSRGWGMESNISTIHFEQMYVVSTRASTKRYWAGNET